EFVAALNEFHRKAGLVRPVLDDLFHPCGGDALRLVPIQTIDEAIVAQKIDRVVTLGHGEARHEPDFKEAVGHGFNREISGSRVFEYLPGTFAENDQLPMVNGGPDIVVGISFDAGKIERIPCERISISGDRKLPRAGHPNDEVAIKEMYPFRTRESFRGDLLDREPVVDIAQKMRNAHEVRFISCHMHITAAWNVSEGDRITYLWNPVQHLPHHDIGDSVDLDAAPRESCADREIIGDPVALNDCRESLGAFRSRFDIAVDHPLGGERLRAVKIALQPERNPHRTSITKVTEAFSTSKLSASSNIIAASARSMAKSFADRSP